MKLRKLIFISSGFLTLALGTLGIFLPVLPTVPLYLLTLILFANSSRRLHSWYIQTGLYKKYLLPYLEAGGLTRRAKGWLIGLVTLQILIAVWLLRNSIPGICICAAVYLGFLLSMRLAVKTIVLPEKGKENRDERQKLRNT